MRFAVLLGSALTLLWPVPVRAADIKGTLYDRSGAVIAGARVLLMSDDYVKLAETKSGERGEFSFTGLNPALYFVQAKKPRFNLSQQHVELKDGQPAHIHMLATVARGEDAFTMTSERLPGVEPPTAPVHAVRAGGRMEPFKLISGRPPAMPELVKKRGVQGTVVLLATITKEGVPTDIVALDSPDDELERVCIEAFGKWRYQPMKLNGFPVEAATTLKLTYEYR